MSQIKHFSNKKGITLTELIIAAGLIALAIGAATSVDIVARRMLHNASKQSQIANEVGLATESVVSDLVKAIGYGALDPGDGSMRGVMIVAGGEGVQIRPDSFPYDGKVDAADTYSILYDYNAGNGQFRVSHDSGLNYDIIANNIISVNFDDTGDSSSPFINFCIAALDDFSPPESIENPRIEISTSVRLPGVSAR